MNSIFVDSKCGAIVLKDVEDKLGNLQAIVDTDCIDIVVREIAGKNYNIICDDNALLKTPVILSAIDTESLHPMLYGNLIICGIDEKNPEKLASLSQGDVVKILQRIKFGIYPVNGVYTKCPVLLAKYCK